MPYQHLLGGDGGNIPDHRLKDLMNHPKYM